MKNSCEPCVLCGKLPKVVREGKNYFNVYYDLCDGEPGVSVCNSVTFDRAVVAWNKWNRHLFREFGIVDVTGGEDVD